MIVTEKSIPHIFRNKYLRDQNGSVVVGGSGGGTVTTITGNFLPANLYESDTYKVDYNTEFLKNLTVNGDTNLKNTFIDGDINLTGKIYVNGEEFKGGSGADLETIDKIDNIENNLNILLEEYNKYGYQYSFSKANDNYLGFTTFIAFPEKQLWNYEYNWQVRGDVHIYTKDFNAIYYVYATGSLSEDGTLTLLDSSCFAIGERRVPVISLHLGGISYGENLPTNPAAHIGFTFRTPLYLDVVAFSHFDVTAYNPHNAGEDWIEYPASEVDYMPLLWDTDGTSTAPDPDKDYYIGYIVNDGYIPVVKMVNSLSDLGITATSDELNILDGALITTEELNSLQGILNNILDTIDNIYEQLKLKYDYLTINVPKTPEKGHIFFDHNGELVYSIGNPPIYQEPIPDSWDGYTNVNIKVGKELLSVDSFWGICMEFPDDLWPTTAEIWVKHDEIWGRVYLKDGKWYADKNAATWLDNVCYSHTAGASGYGYVDLYTESVGLEFILTKDSYGEYEVYAKASGMVKVSYRETMPYFNLLALTIHYRYTVTDEVFVSDDYYLQNDNPVSKLYTNYNINLLGIDKSSTSEETKLIGSLTLSNKINLSTNNDELVISTGKIQGFYTKEETYSKDQADELINARNDEFEQKFKKLIDTWMIPFTERLNNVERQLEDIELALDGILGYETNTYLEETLDEILYQ